MGRRTRHRHLLLFVAIALLLPASARAADETTSTNERPVASEAEAEDRGGGDPAASPDGTPESATSGIAGPDSVQNVLSTDGEEKPDLLDVHLTARLDEAKSWLDEVSGLELGFDYSSLGYVATRSLGDIGAASGIFRIFGYWKLVEGRTPNNGGLVFKVENRHAYSDVVPSDFGDSLGYVGLLSLSFSDQRWRTTNLYWKQHFAAGRGVFYAGFVDVTDYVDVYALASPWTGFSNLAFVMGSGTIGDLPDGALGMMFGGFLSKEVYVAGSIVDANGDPTDIIGGFETFFGDFETFKSFEVGLAGAPERIFLENVHVTFWQVDEREEAGVPSGWGVSASATTTFGEHWLAFLRGGWSKGAAPSMRGAVSGGFGFSAKPGRDLLGFGLNWSRPSSSSYAARLDDQLTIELFERLQIMEKIALTPSIQLIANPALNPDDDFVAIFGLRLRAAF